MKQWLVLVCFLFCVSYTQGQVVCSPGVDHRMCTDAADMLNPIIDHGSPYHGIGIRLEIVTESEYQKRLSDLHDLEMREQATLGGSEKAMANPKAFSPAYKHALNNPWGGKITFFRDTPGSKSVNAILISSEELEGSEPYAVTDAQGNKGLGFRSTGKYDPSSVSRTAGFIGGYLCGTMATFWDGGEVVSDMQSVNK